MTGYCADCKHEETCKKDIGFIWGFCNTDYEPKITVIKEKKHEVFRGP